jgi:hypothetical protein
MKTGISIKDYLFFVNGRLSTVPTITVGEWSMIGVGFLGGIDFRQSSGSMRLNGPYRTTNISFYRQTPEQQIRSAIYRQWNDVLYTKDGSTRKWSFWNDFYTWQTMLVAKPEVFLGSNPEKLYSAYTGTETISSGTNQSLLFGDYQFTIYSSAKSDTITVTPV